MTSITSYGLFAETGHIALTSPQGGSGNLGEHIEYLVRINHLVHILNIYFIVLHIFKW